MDTEIAGTMEIGGKVVIVYNSQGEVLFKASGWDLVDGILVQTEPIKLSEWKDSSLCPGTLTNAVG